MIPHSGYSPWHQRPGAWYTRDLRKKMQVPWVGLDSKFRFNIYNWKPGSGGQHVRSSDPSSQVRLSGKFSNLIKAAQLLGGRTETQSKPRAVRSWSPPCGPCPHVTVQTSSGETSPEPGAGLGLYCSHLWHPWGKDTDTPLTPQAPSTGRHRRGSGSHPDDAKLVPRGLC